MEKESNLGTAQNPLILRYHRLMDAFSKSDDERDFYLDNREGFIVFVDLDRAEDELAALEKKLDASRFFLIPKLTFYETKKIMEGFINEKVYDIDVKEKLADIIQSKEARENFLEFIYDHEAELEKWQQYYQERSRIRIIEWLRHNSFRFVFEEDLDLAPSLIEKLKQNLFNTKVSKDLVTARGLLEGRAKTYYSNEALNPRPKRGRPPKQVSKPESEPQITNDFYMTIPSEVRPFLYSPDITHVSSITFSSKFDSDEEFRARLKTAPKTENLTNLEVISKKLNSLSNLSKKVSAIETEKSVEKSSSKEKAKRPKKEKFVAASEKDELVVKPRRLVKDEPIAPPKEKGFFKRLISKEEGEDGKSKRSILKRARRILKKDEEA